jgi:SpoVK/Ycf46/Vps4 family AAA+-type ATPase
VVSVLLSELEHFPGVVIFATNLAANIDPAFERRIRTHILFEMPDAPARERIWRVQIHSRKTPLADDVDFAELAERYPRSGGDIKNAVLKAAQIATTEPGPDASKRIHQRHFVQGMEEVIAAEGIMGQSLFDPSATAPSSGGVLEQMAEAQEQLRGELGLVAERLDALDARQAGLSDAQAKVLERLRAPAAAPSRAPMYLAAAAIVAAALALVLNLLR